MTTHQFTLTIPTKTRSMINITQDVAAAVAESWVTIGLCNLFIRHTSASLLISENTDPDVQHDLEAFMQRLTPDGDPLFKHQAEGPDDMPAHIRTILTQTSLTIPVAANQLALGTWQGIYLWEQRHHGSSRQVTITLIG